MSMSLHRRKTRYLPSLLDRLIDEDPERSDEPAAVQEIGIQEYLAGIQRDIQSLLNTRRGHVEVDAADYPNAADSLLTYGFPDLTSATIPSRDARHRLGTELEKTLRKFEPRLKRINVVPVVNEKTPSQVHFRIEALVDAHPSPERAVFDTMLDLERNEYKVEKDS